MTTSSRLSFDTQQLLEHEGWVRRLAIGMVGDNSEADDVVQQTWLNALLWPPRRGGDLRRWLATVVRNVVRQRLRGERSERRRRQQVAYTEVDAGDLDALQRLELHEHVASTVGSLRPLDREVLVLRYYDDLTPGQIAARMRLPVSTVKSRLARAKQRLAVRLASTWDAEVRGVDWRAGLMWIAWGRTAAPELAVAVAAPSTAGLSWAGAATGLCVLGLCVGVFLWLGGWLGTDDGSVGGDAASAGFVVAHSRPRPSSSHSAEVSSLVEGPRPGARQPLLPEAAAEPLPRVARARCGWIRDVEPSEEARPRRLPRGRVEIEIRVLCGESLRAGTVAVSDDDEPGPRTGWRTGTAEERAALAGSVDPVCLGLAESAGQERLGEPALRVSDDGGLADVFVALTDVPRRRFAVPDDAVLLDQLGCRYEPRVFGVRVGQVIEIRNSDDTLHNIHIAPQLDREINLAMPTQGMTIERRFERAEEAIPIRCDVHPWMEASCFVMEHPFFSVTDADGRAVISGEPLRDGSYGIGLWHATLGGASGTLVVDGGRSAVELIWEAQG